MNTRIILFCLLSSISLTIYPYRAFTQTINFSGITWNVKSGYGGPGPNDWSNSSSSVWVDGNGMLHLKIRKVGSIWYCAEIYSQQSFCYGEYRFYVASNVENYDKNIVTGLFTYETDTEEIDIEFARWGDISNDDGWYTIQPPVSGNYVNFPLNLEGDYSTHKFIWNSSNIFFQSYHGHYPTLPSPDFLINEWTYTGGDIPPVGNERLHINFWLFQGMAPSNGQEAELIIKSVFIPEQPVAPSGATAIPADICSGGSSTLTVTSGATGYGGNWKWYTGGCGNGSPVGTGASIMVSPAVTTTYYVRAESPCKNTSCASATVMVHPEFNADFSASKTDPQKNETVTFTDLTTGGATAWNWSFDRPGFVFVNGTSPTHQNPQVQFTDGGLYKVTLVASNSWCSDSEVKTGYLRVGTPGLWFGNTSSEWFTGTNWDNHLVPDNAIDVVIPAAATYWPVFTGDLIIGVHCNSLTLSAPTSQITITGSLLNP